MLHSLTRVRVKSSALTSLAHQVRYERKRAQREHEQQPVAGDASSAEPVNEARAFADLVKETSLPEAAIRRLKRAVDEAEARAAEAEGDETEGKQEGQGRRRGGKAGRD